jgi:beta-N-acetylhexosaminidase
MRITVQEANELAGRVLIAGFEGTAIPDYLATANQAGALGGVVLFKRNIESGSQVNEMLRELRANAPEDCKPIASVDQEGGRVARLKDPLTTIPAARKFGQIDDPKLTEIAGRLVGKGLRALGFTLNYAPVLDVNTRPDSPVIGDRSYGETARQVLRHGLSFARGLKDGGTVPCAKHFPGHGDASADSHLSLPSVTHERPRLESVEMEPFAAWARTGLGPIMTAHILFPALDPDLPATLSKTILQGTLRRQFGFKGAILSDDLEMGAVSEMGGPAAAAVKAIRAGVDGLLVCRKKEAFESVHQAVAKEAVQDPAFAQLLIQAWENLETLAHPPGANVQSSWFGSDEHKTLEDMVLSGLEEL